MTPRTECRRYFFGCSDLTPVTLSVIERERVRFESITHCHGERGRGIDAAANEHDGAFHRSSGKLARTVSAMPPRAENSAVTVASRGRQARTKSSRMRFVTASLKARSLR